MKRRLLYLGTILTVFVSLLNIALPALAAADNVPSSDGHPHAQITLTGTSSPQSYTVKGVLGSSTNISFTRSGNVFTSAILPGVGNGCSNNTQTAQQTLNVTVTTGGKEAADPFPMNFCTADAITITKSVAVTSPSDARNPATFSGKATYTDDNGNTQPVGNDPTTGATGQLQGTGNNGQTYNLTFDNSGNIKKINVAPGNYTVTINYVPPGGQNETYTKQISITAGDNYTLNANLSNANSGSEASDTNNANPSPPSCESESGGFNLAWILCPVVEGLANATDGIYSSLIQPLLQTKPINLSTPKSDPSNTYAIWSNFRLYGNIFLVIALLVVVFGESIGGGVIDAYTAKKILPRLLVAAILINISIYIVAVAVDITNIAGNGIAGLIQQPFKEAACSASSNLGTGQNCFALQINGATADIGGLGISSLVLAGGGSIWALAAGSTIALGILGPLLEFLLVFVLIPAFLTFIAIMITVLLRQGLILFLVLISPVAFALYCLPNTEQYFRRWWDLLFKTLLIYPLIATIFALANVLSVTISSGGSGVSAVFADFLAIVALFVPLFLIPFSFRIAGGVLGRFHELATNARKQTHGALIGSERDPDSWRNRTRDKLRQSRREAGLDSRIVGDSLKAVPGSQQWRRNWQARRASSRTLEGQRFLEHDSVALANKGNDQYYLAGANPALARQMRNEAAEKGDVAGARSWDQAIANANLMPKTRAIREAMALEHSKTGFQYAPGLEGYNQMASTAASITGTQLRMNAQGSLVPSENDPTAGAYGDLMDGMQYNEKGAGRHEFAGINRGAGYSPVSGYDKANGYIAGQGKTDSYKAGAEYFLGANLRAGDNADSTSLANKLSSNLSAGTISVDRVAEWHGKLLDGQQSATGANKKEIDKQLQAIEAVANNRQPARDQDKNISLADAVKNNRQQRRSMIDPNIIENENNGS